VLVGWYIYEVQWPGGTDVPSNFTAISALNNMDAIGSNREQLWG